MSALHKLQEMPADSQTRDLLYICCDILNVSLNLGQSNSSAEHRVIQERYSHQDLILNVSECLYYCLFFKNITGTIQHVEDIVGGPPLAPKGVTVFVLSGNTRVNRGLTCCPLRMNILNHVRTLLLVPSSSPLT